MVATAESPQGSLMAGTPQSIMKNVRIQLFFVCGKARIMTVAV